MIPAMTVIFFLITCVLLFFIRKLSGKQEDENMHLLIDALPMCCQIFDRNFNIVECNNASIELYGFKDKKDYIKHFMESCSPKHQPDGQPSLEKARMYLKRAFEDGYYKYEWLYRNLNGEPIQTEVTLIRIKHNKIGYLVAGYTRDLRKHKAHIAEIEKAQKDLCHARDAAEYANKTKSTFLANMSHEIRTPMNSIIGFAELAQQSDNPRKVNEYLVNILHSSEWLLKIINDILDISKIESGKIVLERIPFDLHDVLSLCQMIIQPKVDEKGIGLYCYAEPSIYKKLVGDPVRLRQVLVNLLSNAVKFTNAGTVKLLTNVTESDDNKITITFEVKDSGIGMSAEQISRILEPFIQADNSVTRRFGGTGLGLSITKNIIDLMGGTLVIESAPGIGSKFSFSATFDLVDYDTGIIYQDASLFDIDKPDFIGEVLICEDNNMNQQVICDHLEKVGLKTIIARNGKEGVDIVSERIKNNIKPFDLILMDIHMPVMDGVEASSIINGMGIKSPIVALTANIMHQDIELYKKNGMSECLGKPFTSKELWRCLVKYLPVFNYSSVDRNRQSDEDEEILKKARANFVRNNQDTYAHIVKAAKEGDIKLAHRLSHTLKSNAMQIGKTRLNAAAAALESMFAKGENPLGMEEMTVLETEMESVLDELTPLLAEISAKRKANMWPAHTEPEKILGLFAELETMLINKNPECEDMIDKILSVPGTEELVYQIDKFNFKQAIMELSLLKKEWE
jgi:signal transduction histidine kinase/DNA-binding response OmpR family regulator